MKLFIAFILAACLLIGVHARHREAEIYDMTLRYQHALERARADLGRLDVDQVCELKGIVCANNPSLPIIYNLGAGGYRRAMVDATMRLDAMPRKPVVSGDASFAMREQSWTTTKTFSTR